VIPRFRIRRQDIARDVDRIAALGAKFRFGEAVDDIERLRAAGFTDFFLAAGAPLPRRLDIEGEGPRLVDALAFLAEAIVQPAEIVRYLDADDVEECQLAYHASLMALLWEALATRKTALLALSFGTETRLAPGTAWLSYARCHDDIGLGYDDGHIRRAGYDPALHRRFLVDWYTGRFPGSTASGRPFMANPRTGDARISGTLASLAGLERALASGDAEEIEFALGRIELLHALISSLVGIPMIFSGDELATTNDYSWETSKHHADDNRWMHRPRLDWQRALGTIEGRGKRDGNRSREEPAGRIRRWIAFCLWKRRAIPAFAQDAGFEVLPSGQSTLAVLRRPHEPESPPVLVVANFTGEEREAGFDPSLLGAAAGKGSTVKDLLHEEAVPIPGSRLILPPYGVAWLCRE
jgi:amylosucrase